MRSHVIANVLSCTMMLVGCLHMKGSCLVVCLSVATGSSFCSQGLGVRGFGWWWVSGGCMMGREGGLVLVRLTTRGS
jgi:hypothetical protein